jgi:hypothetical protein
VIITDVRSSDDLLVLEVLEPLRHRHDPLLRPPGGAPPGAPQPSQPQTVPDLRSLSS